MNPITKTYLVSLLLLFIALSLILFMGPEGTITGMMVSVVDVAPEGFAFEPPENVSQEEAGQALEQAREAIEKITQLNLNTTFMEDAFLEANLSYHQEDYLQTIKLAQLIKYLEKENIDLLDKIKLTQQKEEELENKTINTSEGQVLIESALEAFHQEQFDEAKDLLEQAENELEKAEAEKTRAERLTYLSRKFIGRYWWQILLIITILALVSYPITKIIIRKRRKRKLELLRTELNKTQELIKQLQKSCFVDKKMTTKTYKAKTAKYEERIAEIKHTLPVLEAQLKGKKMPEKKKQPKGVLEVKK